MPGLKTSSEKHQAVEEAILRALRSAKGPLSFDQLVEEVRRQVSKEMFATKASLDWYAKAVQLNLEHHGKIERMENPLRFTLPAGEKRTLRQVYHIKASAQEVWQMLIDPQKIEEWSGAPAIMDGAAGTKFSLWEGTIHGENLEIVPERKLVQLWQEQDWQDPSTATFSLRKGDPGETTVELVQTDIPENKLEDIAQGWDEYYLGVIKRQFEK